MASRRQVVQGLSALAGLSAMAGRAFAGRAAPPLYKVIADNRFPESRALAERLSGGRVPMARISGDVTDLWFHDLSLRWKQGPAPIAGVTGRDALFVLERLGWDAGLRVAARTPAPGSQAVAWVMAPARRV